MGPGARSYRLGFEYTIRYWIVRGGDEAWWGDVIEKKVKWHFC